MPEVLVRKRKAKRSQPRAKQWVSDNRPRLIVLAAFFIACVVGVLALKAAQGWLDNQAGESAHGEP